MTSEPATELHELTARYFDGELEGAQEQAALAHLASCAQCQAELGDLIGFEVALQGAAGVAGAAGAGQPVAMTGQPAAMTEPTASTEPVVAATASSSAASSAASSSGGADVAPRGAPVLSLAAARARRRRGQTVLLVMAMAAAAAGVLWLFGGSPAGRRGEEPMLSLAATRGVEARFSAEPFAAHRPYSVVRGGSAREVFPLATLAALEREGQRDALLAAQASTGELARARALLQGAPDRPAREADLAALELLAGQPLAALEAADRALTKEPRLAQALWNRALALRELELPLTAAAALDAVVALAEPGWTQEAKQKADGLRAQLAERASRSQAFTQAGRAMIEGTGPPLTAEDAAARPGLTRQSFHEALRSAASRREALALAPLAEALDGAVESELARREVERVASADFTVRAPLALAYRELVLGRAPQGGPDLLARLARAPGAGAEDLKLGVILLASQTPERAAEHAAELRRLVEATRDPWFLLSLAQEHALAQQRAGAADLAEAALRASLASCDERRWAHRCAQLALHLAALTMDQGKYAEAEQQAGAALRSFRAAGADELEDAALTRLAEARRGQGRGALAAATFEEVRARLGR